MTNGRRPFFTPRILVPLLVIAVLAFIAVAAPLLSPFPYDAQLDIIALKSTPPSAQHWFGTDNTSRDVFSRVLFGARVSLLVAAASVTIALCVGTSYGAIAALAGGFWDALLMRTLDVLLSIPRLLILLAVSAFWSPMPLLPLVVLIGLTGWFDIARLVRGEVHALLRRDFVLAARACGVRRARLLVRHILPHLIPALTVSATLGVAYTIALEAGLSYLGLGVQEPQASWGSIMRLGAAFVDTQWWMTLFPGLATIITVLACNALGDALRDLYAQ